MSIKPFAKHTPEVARAFSSLFVMRLASPQKPDGLLVPLCISVDKYDHQLLQKND